MTNTGAATVMREKDGKRFLTGEKFTVQSGDVLLVSDSRIAIAAELAPPSYYLEIQVDGKCVCQKCLPTGPATIGCAGRSVNEYTVTAVGVSKQHLRITPESDGRFMLEDLQSKNGVYLQRKDQERPERIEKEEIGVEDKFSFGAACGCIHAGTPPVRASKARFVGVLAFGLLSLGLVLMLRPNNSTIAVPLNMQEFSESWTNGDINEGKIYAILEAALISAGTNDCPQRDTLVDLRRMLDLQNTLRDSIQRMNRTRMDAVARLEASPWELRHYDKSFPSEEQHEQTQEEYVQGCKDCPPIAEKMGLPLMAIHERVDPAIADQWKDAWSKYQEAECAIGECRNLMLTWADRQWQPAPSREELERWRDNAAQISSRFSGTTESDIRIYQREMSKAHAYWKAVEGWIKSSLANRQAPMPAPLEIAASAAGPRKWLAVHICEANQKEIASINENIGTKSSFLELAPSLLRMAKLVPLPWRDQSIAETILERYAKEITAQIVLLDRYLEEIGDSSLIEKDKALAVLSRAALDVPAASSQLSDGFGTPESQALRQKNEALQKITVDIAERIYGDLEINEQRRAQIILSLMAARYMENATPSLSAKKDKLARAASRLSDVGR